MQELTNTICKSSTLEKSAVLIDNRDGKAYHVTKLKDNNCWMTQNLDYDDPNSTRITDPAIWTSTQANYRAYYDSGNTINGNYYSWESATNGTGSSVTTDGANASGSICPTNWKLPTSKVTTNGSFAALTSAYSIANSSGEWTKIRSAPLNFVAGGGVWSGKLNNAGSEGYYWSSTAVDSNNAYRLLFYSGDVNPSNNIARYFGYSVRCLVQGS